MRDIAGWSCRVPLIQATRYNKDHHHGCRREIWPKIEIQLNNHSLVSLPALHKNSDGIIGTIIIDERVRWKGKGRPRKCLYITKDNYKLDHNILGIYFWRNILVTFQEQKIKLS